MAKSQEFSHIFLAVDKSVDKLFVQFYKKSNLCTTLLLKQPVFTCFISDVGQTDLARVSVGVEMAAGVVRFSREVGIGR